MNAAADTFPPGVSLLVCVCGGIAAYKVCHVVSYFSQRNVAVRVAMTAEAERFVGPMTFEALSGRPVINNLWEISDASDPQHINLAQRSTLILVAPATANILAKLCHGIADDLVSTVLVAASPERIVLAPAMNEAMWNNPATQANVRMLSDRGMTFIGPDSGWQACRTVGAGRMSEPETLIAALAAQLKI